jgi:hypothetical protein
MFGKTKKSSVDAPISVPKPLPKKVEPVEVEVLDNLEEEPEESVEYEDSEEVEEENKTELTEATVIAYLQNYGQRLDSIESKLFRLKDSL